MSADGGRTPNRLLSSILATPGKLLRLAGRASSTVPAPTASGSADNDAEDNQAAQALAPSSSQTLQACEDAVQDAKASNDASPGRFVQAFSQQAAALDPDKQAALQRFISRPSSSGLQAHKQGTSASSAFGKVFDILKAPPGVNGATVNARHTYDNGPVRHPVRSSRYNPYARPPSRTGAGHVNSTQALYSSSGSRRPLTPMPLSKPATAAQAGLGSDQQQQQNQAEGAPSHGPGLFGKGSPAQGATTAADGPVPATGQQRSMFGNGPAASATAGPLFSSAVSSGFNRFTSTGVLKAGWSSRGFAGGIGASLGATSSATGLRAAPLAAANELPAALRVPPPALPKPTLGLPRAKPPARAPLMGAKRSVAAGAGSSSRAGKGALAAAGGALRPMRSTPLKLGNLAAPGNKRTSEVQGPGVLDAGGTGRKRLRTASPGLRAMVGLGTSSPGSVEGRSSSAGREAAQDADNQQEPQPGMADVPVVQATSVAETIMDTMRSLEQGGPFPRNQPQPTPASKPPFEWLGGGGLRTQLFATPQPYLGLNNSTQAAADDSDGGSGPSANDATPAGSNHMLGAPGGTPWPQKPATGVVSAVPPAAAGAIPKNRTPGSFFTPPSLPDDSAATSTAGADSKAAAGTAAGRADAAEAPGFWGPKPPHVSPVTPWQGSVSGAPFGTPIALSATEQQRQRQQQKDSAAAAAFGGCSRLQNGRIFRFGADRGPDVNQAVARAAQSVSEAAVQQVPVRTFTFSASKPVKTVASHSEADQQQQQKGFEQQQQPGFRWQDSDCTPAQQKQQQPSSTPAAAGNPLLVISRGNNAQSQQWAATPGAGWGISSASGASASRPNGIMSGRDKTPDSAGFKWGANASAADIANDSPVFNLPGVKTSDGAAGLADGSSAFKLPPGTDPALLADQVKKAADIPLPPDSEDEDNDQKQQQAMATNEAAVITGGDHHSQQEQQQQEQNAGTAAAGFASSKGPSGTGFGGATDGQKGTAATQADKPDGTTEQRTGGIKAKRKKGVFSAFDAVSEEDEGLEAGGALQQQQDSQQQQQQQQEAKNNEQQQQWRGQVDEPPTQQRRKRQARVADAAAASAALTSAPAAQTHSQQPAPLGSPSGPSFGDAGFGSTAGAGSGGSAAAAGSGGSAGSAGLDVGFASSISGKPAFAFGTMLGAADNAASKLSTAAGEATTSKQQLDKAPAEQPQQAGIATGDLLLGMQPSASADAAGSGASTPPTSGIAAQQASMPTFSFGVAPTSSTGATGASGSAAAAAPLATEAAAAPLATGFMFGVQTSSSAPFAAGIPSAAVTDSSTAAMEGADAALKPATGFTPAASSGPATGAAANALTIGSANATTPRGSSSAAAGFGSSLAAVTPSFGVPSSSTPASGGFGGFAFGIPTSSNSGGGTSRSAAAPAAGGFLSGASSAAAAGSGSASSMFGTSSSSAAARTPTFAFGSRSSSVVPPSSEAAASAPEAAALAVPFGAPTAPSAGGGGASSAPGFAFLSAGGSGSLTAGPTVATKGAAITTFGGFGASTSAQSAPAAAGGFMFGAPGSTAAAESASNAPAAAAAHANGTGFSFGAVPAAAAIPAGGLAGGAAPGLFSTPAAGIVNAAAASQPTFSFGASPAAPVGAAATSGPAAAPFGGLASAGTGGFPAAASQPAFGFGANSTAQPPAVATQAPFGGFGATAQQQQQPLTLFGQPAQQQQQPAALFGQPAQQQQQPAALFAFGAAPPQQQQQPPPNPFGAPVAGTGFAFGAQTPQAAAAPAPAPFGASNNIGFAAPQQQQQPGFGGFNGPAPPAAAPFGAPVGGAAAAEGGAMFTLGAAQGGQQGAGQRRLLKARRKGR